MTFKFHSAWYCPFAQRAWMTLLLKRIDFEYIEVDPYQESEWWADTSRGHNQVPVLMVEPDNNGTTSTIIDSTRVVEYLEEIQPEYHPLMPSYTEARAEVRYWIDHINQGIVPYMYRFLQAAKPGRYRDESRESLTQGIEKLFSSYASDGVYLGGDQVNILDLLLIPFAYRIDALLGHYRDFSLPKQGETWQRYQRWYDAMCEHEAFVSSQSHGENYRNGLIEFYLPYSKGGGQKGVAMVT
ncbi:MAG: glutathione S-transferase family protein [bacterium]